MNSSKYRLLIAAVFFALTLWPAALAIAQSNKADELNRRINELYQAGQFAEAIPLAQEVLAIREKELRPADPTVAKALDRLAELYVKQGRYADAEPLYKRALVIYEEAFGPVNPSAATDLDNLADVYRAEGRTAEAETFHRRAQAMLDSLIAHAIAAAQPSSAGGYVTGFLPPSAPPSSTITAPAPAAPPPPPVESRSRGLSVPPRAAPAAPAPGPSAVPVFPWPPPAASASYVLPHDLFKDRNTIGQSTAAIVAALESEGYVDRSFFATPAGGVALVTRLERINDDGSHVVETQRWPAVGKDQQYSSTLDLTRLLRGLFFAEPGRYRIIVFILQNEAFSQSETRISEEDAQAWLHKGLNVLPPELADRSFDKGDCTALIYEFVNTGGGVHTVESQITGRQHLRMAGLRVLLGDSK